MIVCVIFNSGAVAETAGLQSIVAEPFVSSHSLVRGPLTQLHEVEFGNVPSLHRTPESTQGSTCSGKIHIMSPCIFDNKRMLRKPLLLTAHLFGSNAVSQGEKKQLGYKGLKELKLSWISISELDFHNAVSESSLLVVFALSSCCVGE